MPRSFRRSRAMGSSSGAASCTWYALHPPPNSATARAHRSQECARWLGGAVDHDLRARRLAGERKDLLEVAIGQRFGLGLTDLGTRLREDLPLLLVDVTLDVVLELDELGDEV